ncbi:interleukin-15 isoform X2 [Scleropages formosus]|uniref:interleukin-15 isoform X2 n=1 Tax=Scleropages formosus TaxID=113540 RepID=UPI0010FA814F|nr:interleukin-15 isoform X2 [Scleropages formosus]
MSPLVIALCLTVIGICVLLQDCRTKKNVRGVCVLWCFHCCQSCPSTCDIWITFFALSCLSTSMPLAEANKVQELLELQHWIQELEPQLQGSDATLYAPTNQDVTEDCVPAAMQCYLLELEVIMFEKDVEDKDENIKLRKNSSSLQKLLTMRGAPGGQLHSIPGQV